MSDPVVMPAQAAALRRRRALQRQVLYTKPVTAEAGKPVQASSGRGRPRMTCLGSREHAQRLPCNDLAVPIRGSWSEFLQHCNSLQDCSRGRCHSVARWVKEPC